MSALADFAHKFGSESRELRIGQSFFNDADSCFHTIRYDFVPASVDPNKTSLVDFGGNGKVTVTMPNLEGSGTGRESVYQGMRKPHQKECVLIFNPETGELVLEKLNTSMIVKKARLRQEDMTGKSLNSHNNNQKSTLSNGSSSGPSTSQAKSSIHNDKAKSSTLKSATTGQNMPTMGSVAGKLSNKTSPPLSSAIASSSSSLTAQSRTNGFRQKTPSPPSMPIFSANKGSLLHPNATPATSGRSSDSSQDWNGITKSKEPSQAAATAVAVSKSSHKHGTNHSSSSKILSDDSSSDSDANSEDESESSSQSSDSSSEDEEMRPVSMTELSTSKQTVNGVTNALSMPSFLSSMNSNSLTLPSALDSTSPSSLLHSSSSNAKSPTELSKKVPQAISSASALSLSLSEDSDDSSDGETSVTPSRHLNGSDTQQKKDLPKGGSPLESGSKGSPFDSMPKFLNNGSAPSALSVIPKVTYSQLSQDLQLSESGSDSDDD